MNYRVIYNAISSSSRSECLSDVHISLPQLNTARSPFPDARHNHQRLPQGRSPCYIDNHRALIDAPKPGTFDGSKLPFQPPVANKPIQPDMRVRFN